MNIEKHPFHTHGVLPLSTNGSEMRWEIGGVVTFIPLFLYLNA